MLVSWNVRGLNKSGKLKEISSRLNLLKPDIVILIETRVMRDKAKNIRDKLHVHDCYVDNYHYHESGRIWISWNDSAIDVKVVNSSDQYIHCGIFDNNGTFL